MSDEVKRTLAIEATCFATDWRLPLSCLGALTELLFHAWCIGNNAERLRTIMDRAEETARKGEKR